MVHYRIPATVFFTLVQNWGSELSERGELVSEFFESLEKFSRNLLGAKDNMNNHFLLMDTEYAAHLDSMRSAADYKTASK